jgi:hypothetical protein
VCWVVLLRKCGQHRQNVRIPAKLLRPFIQERLQKKVNLQQLQEQQLNVDADDMDYQTLSDVYRKLVHQPQVRILCIKMFLRFIYSFQIIDKILSENGELELGADVVTFKMFFQFLQSVQQVCERRRLDTSICGLQEVSMDRRKFGEYLRRYIKNVGPIQRDIDCPWLTQQEVQSLLSIFVVICSLSTICSRVKTRCLHPPTLQSSKT